MESETDTPQARAYCARPLDARIAGEPPALPGLPTHLLRRVDRPRSARWHLLALGVPPGPRMGEILKQVYERQLDGEVRSVEEGVAEARRILTSGGD